MSGLVDQHLGDHKQASKHKQAQASRGKQGSTGVGQNTKYFPALTSHLFSPPLPPSGAKPSGARQKPTTRGTPLPPKSPPSLTCCIHTPHNTHAPDPSAESDHLSEAQVNVAEAGVTSSDAGGADDVSGLQNLPLRGGAQSPETLLICRHQLALGRLRNIYQVYIYIYYIRATTLQVGGAQVRAAAKARVNKKGDHVNTVATGAQSGMQPLACSTKSLARPSCQGQVTPQR